MIERSMVKPYLHYVIPATIAFTLSCIYAIVDGIFVGNYVGDAGLAGINVAYPLYALIYATGTGIGMGGAIIASVREGAGNVKGSRRAMGHTITLLAIASVIVMTFLLIFARPACGLLGGSGA
ncbi:MAG: MATE family efflux transporter, partial [Eggerthellaceae bacterium]